MSVKVYKPNGEWYVPILTTARTITKLPLDYTYYDIPPTKYIANYGLGAVKVSGSGIEAYGYKSGSLFTLDSNVESSSYGISYLGSESFAVADAYRFYKKAAHTAGTDSGISDILANPYAFSGLYLFTTFKVSQIPLSSLGLSSIVLSEMPPLMLGQELVKGEGGGAHANFGIRTDAIANQYNYTDCVFILGEHKDDLKVALFGLEKFSSSPGYGMEVYNETGELCYTSNGNHASVLKSVSLLPLFKNLIDNGGMDTHKWYGSGVYLTDMFNTYGQYDEYYLVYSKPLYTLGYFKDIGPSGYDGEDVQFLVRVSTFNEIELKVFAGGLERYTSTTMLQVSLDSLNSRYANTAAYWTDSNPYGSRPYGCRRVYVNVNSNNFNIDTFNTGQSIGGHLELKIIGVIN